MGTDSLDTDEDGDQAMENELVASKLDCNHDDQPIGDLESPGRATEKVCSQAQSRHKRSKVTHKLYSVLICAFIGPCHGLIPILCAGRVGMQHKFR